MESTPEYREPETNILPDAIMREAGVDDLPDDPDEDGLSTPEYRKGETVTKLAAILGATQLPNDPSAARAAYPGSHPTSQRSVCGSVRRFGTGAPLQPVWPNLGSHLGTAIYTAGPIPESSKAFSKRIASIQRIAKP